MQKSCTLSAFVAFGYHTKELAPDAPKTKPGILGIPVLTLGKQMPT
jgi:hypothetical protein